MEVISPELRKQIESRIPRRFAPDQLPIGPIELNNSPSRNVVADEKKTANQNIVPYSAPQPPVQVQPIQTPNKDVKDYAEAMYDYKGQDSSDLDLKRGDKISILEHVNNDWWRGEVAGRVGIFPSNYVKIISAPDDISRSNVYGSSVSQPPNNFYQPPAYSQSSYVPPNQPQQFSAPQPFPPPSTNYYQPPAQQQVQVEQPQKDSTAKKYGKKFGDAAVFGAGATVGSNIINSIF